MKLVHTGWSRPLEQNELFISRARTLNKFILLNVHLKKDFQVERQSIMKRFFVGGRTEKTSRGYDTLTYCFFLKAAECFSFGAATFCICCHFRHVSIYRHGTTTAAVGKLVKTTDVCERLKQWHTPLSFTWRITFAR